MNQFTERKVVRRGMIAALASLGAAAMLKATGAGKAGAANGEELLIGNALAPQTATSNTVLLQTGSAFRVLRDNGGQVTTSAILGSNGNEGANQHGVIGAATGSTNAGILGRNLDAGGVGVFGNVGSAANAIGVSGQSTASSSIGVQGKGTGGPGVEGISVNSLGVRGISTNSTAVVGISTNNHGLYGSTSAAGAVGLVGENLGGGLAGYFAGNVQITGGLQVFGAKNAVIRMQDGTNGSVYCQESPEPYFEDFGRGQLTGGVANVTLEREFAGLVGGADYMVFLTPAGDTRGLYVSRQGPGGFEVRECQAGTGSIPFTYRVVTKRRDIEGRRFARVTDNVGQSLAASRAALGITGGPTVNSAPPGQQTPSAFVPQTNPPAPSPTQPSLPAPNPASNLIPPGPGTGP